MSYALTEALIFVGALIVGSVCLFLLGRMAGRADAEELSEPLWDTAILLGSYGEQLRQTSRETGIPVAELTGITLPPRPAGSCPLCGSQ